jgi:hypothetical protein
MKAPSSSTSDHGDSALLEETDLATMILSENAFRDALSQLGRFWSRRITASCNGSVIRLQGTVQSWFQKQQCQHVAAQLPGVTQVQNEIVVQNDEALRMRLSLTE